MRNGTCNTLADSIEKLFQKDEVLHWAKKFCVS
jgi:hypothetical protein